MFAKEIYIQRRAELKRRVGEGLILLFGNNDAPNNYPANTYRFRQDSCFLYYFGLKREGLVGLIDVDNDKEYIFGDDIDINDIIWYGYVPSVKELATEAGVQHTAPMKELKTSIDTARSQGKPIHYIPQCRHDLMIQLSDLIGIHPLQLNAQASVTLIKAIVDMRSIKKPEEVEELKKAADIGYQMHTTAMKLCAPGVTEKYIAGVIGRTFDAMRCRRREQGKLLFGQHTRDAHFRHLHTATARHLHRRGSSARLGDSKCQAQREMAGHAHGSMPYLNRTSESHRTHERRHRRSSQGRSTRALHATRIRSHDGIGCA